ncbi:ATP-binding protein [Streptomyces sp. NPDC015532]|uniref:ATP-binding protein n=1 Tax=Streptomyces sp. NPDC015532 TaxID=3364960 RepID=UPI0036F86919
MTFREAPTFEDSRQGCDQRTPAGSERVAIRSFEVALAPADARVWLMRRITLAHLRLWDLMALDDTATLAVSALVTNAVRHCHGNTIRLRVVSLGEELRIEVRDGNPTPARQQDVDADAESGRGLLLVAALAKVWGLSRDGTMTWCSLPLPAEERANEALTPTPVPRRGRSDRGDQRSVSAPTADPPPLAGGTP